MKTYRIKRTAANDPRQHPLMMPMSCLMCSVWCLVFLVRPTQAAPTMEWVPVRANGGDFTINGNEIILTDHTAPVEVELDLRLSGWGSAAGEPLLTAYFAELNRDSLAGGWGAPLSINGAFIITNTCSESGNPCNGTFDPTCDGGVEGFCIRFNPDHPFDSVFDLCALSPLGTYCGVSNAGLFDSGDSVHGGYLILDIPTDAKGTYVIELIGDPNATGMHGSTGPISGLVLTPALITIPLPVGRCCSNIGPDVACEDNVTAQNCAMRPEPSLFTVGETCEDECACPLCLSDADCNIDNACTVDTCDECGQCVHTPIFNVDEECCNPADGHAVWIDDDDPCTNDTCDASTGQVSHAGVPDCVSFDVDAFPKNRYVSFETGVQPGALAFQVRMTASDLFPESIGDLGWVDVPDSKGTAMIVPDPVFSASWPAVVRASDCEIVPAATYEIRATGDGVSFDAPVVVETTARPGIKIWGDIVGEFNGIAWSPPNGVLNFADVQAAIKTFQNGDSTAPLIWADIGPETPNRVVNFNEVLWLLLAFIGEPYPFGGPADCP